MTFPTPYVVRQQVFTGVGEDRLGNDVLTWADAVDVKAICYNASTVESLAGDAGSANYTSRVIADIDLALPPDAVVSEQDRFQLPDDDDVFEVVAVEDANHGFHQWHPGIIVKLKRVSG